MNNILAISIILYTLEEDGYSPNEAIRILSKLIVEDDKFVKSLDEYEKELKRILK